MLHLRHIDVERGRLDASTEGEISAAFAMLPQLRAGALVVGTSTLFSSRPEQFAALAARQKMPTIYQYHEFAAGGGLVSYGANIAASYQQTGTYVGRVLKGEKPADLPVQQSEKIELIVNLKTAKALGIAVSLPLLGRADEVIE